MYLYGIGALAVEIPQREVLLKLLEQEFYFPSLAVYGDYFSRVSLHVVRQQGNEPWLLALEVCVSDYPGIVPYVVPAFDVLGEHDLPDHGLHDSFRKHVHRVRDGLEDEVLLHFRDINNTPPGQLLELRVVNVSPVHGDDVPGGVVGWHEHEAVAGSRRSEAYVRRHALVGVDVHMDFQSAFLLSRFRMAADALEHEVGEQRYRGGVDDLQAFEPRGHPPPAAVRGKLVLVPVVQAEVGEAEHTLRPAGVCVRECAATRHHAYAKVRQLTGLGEHRVADFTQGIETPDDGIEHYNKMLPRIETLYVTFAAVFTAELKDFRLGK